MNKKSLLGLTLFACIIISGMFLTTEILIEQTSNIDSLNAQLSEYNQTEDKSTDQVSMDYAKADNNHENQSINQSNKAETPVAPTKGAEQEKQTEETIIGFSANTVTGSPKSNIQTTTIPGKSAEGNTTKVTGTPFDKPDHDSVMATADAVFKSQLIYDYTKVNYKSQIPEMIWDDDLRDALAVKNPDIDVTADAAILFDAKTKKVLYYKNPVKAVFPASTLKLLTSMVALDWCSTKEEVTIGDEIKMIASDSTRAHLVVGEKLTIESLIEGMLLPSGNDAAYAVAAYVGRKSLHNPNAPREEAIVEFRRLMNNKAKDIGVKNSFFMTPDGYDALGQYTTAYDMGLIAIAAIGYDKITEISKKSSCSTTFVSGQQVTWRNTNRLIKSNSGKFYSPVFGLKTGTSNMAGKCLISAAKKDGKEVVSVILHSDSVGRWDDSLKLLKYGLK